MNEPSPRAPFLERVAREWAAQTPPEQWHRTAWVLPSRRAERFLRQALSDAAPGPVLAPLTVSLDRLFASLAELRPISSLEAMLRFYPLYVEAFESHAEPFESYVQWAGGVLKDLNEIDRQGADFRRVWKATAEWESLEQWGKSLDGMGSSRGRRLALLRALPDLHERWHEHLAAEGVGTTGLILRTASPADRGPDPTAWKKLTESWGIDRWVFAGFNALTPCEEALFRFLLERGEATVRFDADEHYLNDPHHEAGMYLRRFKDQWPADAVKDLHVPSRLLRSAPKRIEVLGVAGAVGLAKTAGAWVVERQKEDPKLERTAVVLADESLLLPMLHALPEVDANVTMGLPLASLPVTAALEALIHVHETAEDGAFNYRDLVGFLEHPGSRVWLGDRDSIARWVSATSKTHQVRWTWDQLAQSEALKTLTGLEVLAPAESPVAALERIAAQLESVDETSAQLRDWERTAAQKLASTLRGAVDRCRAHGLQPHWRALRALLQPFFREEPLDLLGEPLAGLQIMGLLETRLLDFEAVLVVGANEGVLPPARGDLGWIPWSVRTDLGLPLPNEREAINAYHFYRLLQHPGRITLLYSTDSDATGGGEPSRYLHQMHAELRSEPNFSWYEGIRFAPMHPHSRIPAVTWDPEPEALQTLKSRLENPETALSPSKLSQFLRDPEQFYLEYLLRARPEDEPKERIDDALFGNIVHKAHEVLYGPLIQNPSAHLLLLDDARWNEILSIALASEYPGGQVETGKNALAYRVGTTLLRELARADAVRWEQSDALGLSLHGVEVPLNAVLETESGPVHFRGKADRMERTPAGLAILDLKTGAVEAKDLKFKQWEHLLVPDKGSKPLQLMTYAWMHARMTGERQPVRVGIVPLRQPQSEPLWLQFNGRETLGPDDLEAFESQVLRPLIAALRTELSWSDLMDLGKAQSASDAE